MSAERIGRGFEALPIEDQVQALRDHALGQELLIGVLLTAVEWLGVTLVWGDEDETEGEGQA